MVVFCQVRHRNRNRNRNRNKTMWMDRLLLSMAFSKPHHRS